jgi:hypothetical protein
VDHDVDPGCLLQHRGDRAVDRFLIGHVHVDRTQGDAVFVGVSGGGSGCLGIAASAVSHAGVGDVVGVSECTHCQCTEAAGCSGDEDDLRFRHEPSPFRRP